MAAQTATTGQEKLPPVDLDAMTIPQLRALSAAADAVANEKLQAAQDAVLTEARGKLAELGVSLDDLLKPHEEKGRKSSSGGSGKVPAKYRGPNGEEWSGRGRLPQWVQVVEAEGRSRKEFII